MAGFLEISMDGAGNLVITGDVNAVTANRRALRFMKDYTVYQVSGGSIVFFIGDGIPKTIGRIKTIAGYAGCRVGYSKEVDGAVREYATEDQKFEDFSKAALDIRNNHCNAADFGRFKNSLLKNMAGRVLYPLQMLSAYHLAFSQNACNFSVPGAGKTTIVYGAYTYLKHLPVDDIRHVDKILVIGPLSSFGPWESEYAECFGRGPVSKRLVGGMPIEEKRMYLYGEGGAELTLLSYASVIAIQEELLFFLRENKTMVVLDEAHKIKNTNGGVTAKSVLAIAQQCRSRVVLTGTPAPNGYEDLLNLFKFIWPTKDIIRFQVGQLRDMSHSQDDPRVAALLQAIMPYFVRIKKGDLGIPPAINHPPVVVPMKKSQQRIYDFIEKKYMQEIASAMDKRFIQEIAGARVIRLMQVATNPELLRIPLSGFSEIEGMGLGALNEDSQFIQEILQYHENETPAKFEVALDLIRGILSGGGKVVVWACYIKTIEAFQLYLESQGVASRILYGATPIAADGLDVTDERYEYTREAIIRQFHLPDSPFRVIIANPFAVAESISLHKACHNAVYLERSFNAAHFIQSKDRIHRYGLPPGVETNYYYLVSAGTIDGVVDQRLAEKERRLLEIIESMPIPLFDNASETGGIDDIKAILGDYARRVKKI